MNADVLQQLEESSVSMISMKLKGIGKKILELNKLKLLQTARSYSVMGSVIVSY